MRRARPYLLVTVLCWGAFICPTRALAAKPVVLKPGQREYPLGLHLQYLEDQDLALKIKDVTSPPVTNRFTDSDSAVPNFGFKDSAYWFRFDLHSSLDKRQDLILEVRYALLDRIEIYTRLPDGRWTRRMLGDTLPYGGKIIRHTALLFPLRAAAGQQQRLYLRIKTRGAMLVPLTLWTLDGFRDHEHEVRMLYGLYCGFFIVMIFYNLFLFVATRERSYLLFVFYVLTVFAFETSNDGIAQEYLWPGFPWWSNRVMPLSLTGMCFFGLYTSIEFLSLKQNHPRWNRVLAWCGNLALGGAFGSFFLPYNAVTKFGAFWVAPSVLLILIASVLSLFRGYTLARYFVAGWGALFIGVLMISFNRLGLLPSTPLTEHAQLFGHVVSIILLSIALADRINIMKQQKDRAQAEALRAQQQAAATLEQEVDKKTQQLQSKTHELEEAYDRLAEHDRLKSSFFANVSHELRTPLTLIITPLERLLAGDSGDLPESARDRLRSMEGNTKRLLRLVNQLLDFSRLESGGMNVVYQPVDIHSRLRPVVQAFDSFARSKGINLVLRTAGELPTKVYTDPTKLEKVISNLLSNACKFTEPNGSVVVRLTSDDRAIKVSVRDSGIGISEEDLPKVFDRFHQADSGSSRRYEGSGIGLSLSKELVELIGGTLEVESELGVFSMFTVTLPLGKDHIRDPSLIREEPESSVTPEDYQPAEADALALAAETGLRKEPSVAAVPASAESAPTVAGGREDIRPLLLVVEDNADMRKLVAEICADDFSVMEASEGEEALELIREHRPALVISDVMMPGMDGTELLQNVRSDPSIATIPVMLLTAKSAEDLRLEGLERGADDYLIKPFESRELRSRAKNLVRLQQQERDLRRLNASLQQDVVSQSAQLERARMLGKFLPPEVVQSVLDGAGTDPGVQIQQERRPLTVFRLELRGFRTLVETLDPEKLTALLNGYLSEMMEIAFAHGATVDKFIQDRVIGFFGAPGTEGTEKDALICAEMALEMRSRAIDVCHRWRDVVEGEPPVPTMFLASGYATVGYFGSSKRLDYTAVGGPFRDAADLLPVLEPGDLACSHGTWNLIQNEMNSQGSVEVSLRHRKRPLRIYRLVGHPAAQQAAAVDASDAVSQAPDDQPEKPLFDEGGDLIEGARVARRYQILNRLGQGGWGTVYQARDLKLATDVALKMVNVETDASQRALKNLYWEVKLARLINHPNVARIYDISEWQGFEFISMECIEGKTLTERLKGAQAIPLPEGINILHQVCAGLSAAHAAGIVHRDLKPSNIMLEEGGRVVILDFGTARWASLLKEGSTETRQRFLGTPLYMAPEQFSGENVDLRADIYALGVMAFEMFTGRRPFIATNPVALGYQHVHVPPMDPLALRPDLPPRLAVVILRCLEKSPQDRFRTVEELRAMLEGLA